MPIFNVLIEDGVIAFVDASVQLLPAIAAAKAGDDVDAPVYVIVGPPEHKLLVKAGFVTISPINDVVILPFVVNCPVIRELPLAYKATGLVIVILVPAAGAPAM